MNLDLFKEIVESANLTRLGFSVFEYKTEITSDYSVAPNNPRFVLLASNKNLVMRIGYVPYISLVSFSKSEKDYFLMRDFVLAKGIMPKEDFEMMFNRSGEETEEHYLRRTLCLIFIFVEKYLQKYVDGSAWESIPHDWFGYK